MGKVFFGKKMGLSPQNETKLMLDFFLFYILLIWGVRTHPTHPLPTGLKASKLFRRFRDDIHA